MKKDVNQCINDILNGDPVNYRIQLFSLKSAKEFSFYDGQIVTRYYFIVRALSHVAKKRYKYQFDMLLKHHAPMFWKPDADMLEQEWFSEGLLEIISLIRKAIRELQLDLEGLTDGNYGRIQRILFAIEDYKLYLDYLHDVYEYTKGRDWLYDEYLQIDVYEYKIHTLDSVQKLEKHGITLEDIIEDISKSKHEFYTIAIFWYLGVMKNIMDDTGKTSNNALGIILGEWFLHGAKPNTIAIYLAYLRNHDENKITISNSISSYETKIHEVKEKYIKVLGV